MSIATERADGADATAVVLNQDAAWVQRPDDADAFVGALREVRRRTEVPVVFGGRIASGNLTISELDGTRTRHLHGLMVEPGAGLGGRVMVQRRPTFVSDYARSRLITHDYDRPVLAEGIRDLAAAPVLVQGRVRGVLYAGARAGGAVAADVPELLTLAARRLARELYLRDEVDRRVRLVLAGMENTKGTALDVVRLEEMRDLHSELRLLARSVGDDDMRERLFGAADRLAALASDQGEQPRSALAPTLSPREVEVLAEAGLGCTNAEIGRRLSLTPETVKAYLRSASRKLGVHNRHEAVVAARRLGLLI